MGDVCLASAGVGLLSDRARAAEPAVGASLPTVDEIRSRSDNLWKLVDLINAYRVGLKLAAIPLSPKLTAVAALHVRDLAENRPHEKFGSLHAWSKSDRWTGGAFTAGDQSTYPVMWNKPREIAGYDGHGFEISASGARDANHALKIWQGSPPHHDVILNRGIWRDQRWQALGAVIERGFACAWFGKEVDG